jgi:hypothetical protein
MRHRVGSVVDAAGLGSGLEPEGVLDGDEVKQAALGLASEVRPVASTEQLLGSRGWLAPRGLVPPRTIQRHR